jgi:hypothetical protein
MELVRDAAPGEKGIADVAASLIQSGVLDRIADVFAQRNAAPAAPGAPPPAPRAIPSNLPPPGPIQQQYLMELVVQVGQMAEQVPQPDIAEVADFVDFNAPPAMVRELVYNDQLFEQLQLVPIVAKHRGFFAALRENLAAGMIGPDEGASDENNDTRQPTARPGGDAGDTKANAPAGAGGQAA